jgi:hypothetical protein
VIHEKLKENEKSWNTSNMMYIMIGDISQLARDGDKNLAAFCAFKLIVA